MRMDRSVRVLMVREPVGLMETWRISDCVTFPFVPRSRAGTKRNFVKSVAMECSGGWMGSL